MITNHRKVVWAEELGIDMEKLRREHPDHWDQIMMKKRLGEKAEQYWARERYLARVADEAKAVEPEPVVEHVEPKPRKKRSTGKLGRYEFTDRQLEIARRVLNARKAV